jgi:hypothetical protein
MILSVWLETVEMGLQMSISRGETADRSSQFPFFFREGFSESNRFPFKSRIADTLPRNGSL